MKSSFMHKCRSSYTVGLVDDLTKSDLVDQAILLKKLLPAISNVFFNIAAEHFLVGQKLRCRVLKSTYIVKKVVLFSKKIILLNLF